MDPREREFAISVKSVECVGQHNGKWVFLQTPQVFITVAAYFCYRCRFI